ncbi:hypothetical protein AF72_07295 [Xylella taiwanensis]|uniref:Uncharacterized protein n=1 Tax=Xylella taiwanensis TaxID=1444770 RepID=Z9JIZ1_9GAMM|nr:hypothetical protein AF72_07295 [Xylella taiwanensis]
MEDVMVDLGIAKVNRHGQDAEPTDMLGILVKLTVIPRQCKGTISLQEWVIVVRASVVS